MTRARIAPELATADVAYTETLRAAQRICETLMKILPEIDFLSQILEICYFTKNIIFNIFNP